MRNKIDFSKMPVPRLKYLCWMERAQFIHLIDIFKLDIMEWMNEYHIQCGQRSLLEQGDGAAVAPCTPPPLLQAFHSACLSNRHIQNMDVQNMEVLIKEFTGLSLDGTVIDLSEQPVRTYKDVKSLVHDNPNITSDELLCIARQQGFSVSKATVANYKGRFRKNRV